MKDEAWSVYGEIKNDYIVKAITPLSHPGIKHALYKTNANASTIYSGDFLTSISFESEISCGIAVRVAKYSTFMSFDSQLTKEYLFTL